MTSEEVQQKLLEHLQKELQFTRTERKLYLSPAERHARVQFYEAAINEVNRLAEFEKSHPQ